MHRYHLLLLGNLHHHGAQDMRNVECVKEKVNFHVKEYHFLHLENEAGLITSMRSFYQLKSTFLAHNHHKINNKNYTSTCIEDRISWSQSPLQSIVLFISLQAPLIIQVHAR